MGTSNAGYKQTQLLASDHSLISTKIEDHWFDRKSFRISPDKLANLMDGSLMLMAARFVSALKRMAGFWGLIAILTISIDYAKLRSTLPRPQYGMLGACFRAPARMAVIRMSWHSRFPLGPLFIATTGMKRSSESAIRTESSL